VVFEQNIVSVVYCLSMLLAGATAAVAPSVVFGWSIGDPNRTTEPVAMSEVHKAARENMTRKGTAFDSAFHAAQQVQVQALYVRGSLGGLFRLPAVGGLLVHHASNDCHDYALRGRARHQVVEINAAR